MTVGEPDNSLYIIVGSAAGGFVLLVIVVTITIAFTICCTIWIRKNHEQVKKNDFMEMEVMPQASTLESDKKIDFGEVD